MDVLGSECWEPEIREAAWKRGLLLRIEGLSRLHLTTWDESFLPFATLADCLDPFLCSSYPSL